MRAAKTRAGVLPKRKPMKSGIVSESIAAVKLRSRGATTIHENRLKATAVGMKRSHGRPHA